MTRTLRWLAAAGIILLAGYGAMLAVWPEARPSWRSARAPAVSPVEHASQHRAAQGTYEQIPAEIVICPADEIGPLEGCPKTQLGAILGVGIGQPHGITVADVVPDGPAAEAGVLPGDQLGLPADCPKSTIGRFLPGDEARAVAITITRRQPEETDASEGDEAAVDLAATAEPPPEQPGPSY